jgi:hypothetical protein
MIRIPSIGSQARRKRCICLRVAPKKTKDKEKDIKKIASEKK